MLHAACCMLHAACCKLQAPSLPTHFDRCPRNGDLLVLEVVGELGVIIMDEKVHLGEAIL